MALLGRCPACDEKISMQATLCPNCGQHLKPGDMERALAAGRIRQIIGISILLLFILFIVYRVHS